MQPFPRNVGQRVVTASPALHFLLPPLRDRMVHLTLLKKIAISEEPLFSEDLFISPFSASFLHEVVRKVLPVEWEGIGAMCLNWDSGDGTPDPFRNLEGEKFSYMVLVQISSLCALETMYDSLKALSVLYCTVPIIEWYHITTLILWRITHCLLYHITHCLLYCRSL